MSLEGIRPWRKKGSVREEESDFYPAQLRGKENQFVRRGTERGGSTTQREELKEEEIKGSSKTEKRKKEADTALSYIMI